MKKIISIFTVFALAFVCCSCSAGGVRASTKYSTSFLDLFDTASTVIAYDTSQKAFDAHYEQFYNRLAEYDRLYDIYKSYDGINNLCTLNKKAKDAPVKVDSRIIDLLEYCKKAYEISKGKTNVCFGSVLKLWHTSREIGLDNPKSASLPDMNKLKEAKEHTSFDDLIIDRENSTVYFADDELYLDVGAVAKGYAAQQVCTWAKENLWSAAAISIGGNVCTFGFKNNNGKTKWTIGIENPDLSVNDYLLKVKITDMSVVTSGDYQRYYTVDGKKYCHIINPDTLMPAEYVASVSVLCNDSALGDVLSTALFNMPVDEGKRLVEGMDGVEAVWVDKNYEKAYSSGFEQYVDKTA